MRIVRICAGRSLIDFYFRKGMEAVTEGVEDRKTDAGAMKPSSAALIALDLVRCPQASGGIDVVAKVPSDFGQTIDPDQLTALSAVVARPVVQRLGHLLDHLGHDSSTGPMLESLRARGGGALDRTSRSPRATARISTRSGLPEGRLARSSMAFVWSRNHAWDVPGSIRARSHRNFASESMPRTAVARRFDRKSRSTLVRSRPSTPGVIAVEYRASRVLGRGGHFDVFSRGDACDQAARIAAARAGG